MTDLAWLDEWVDPDQHVADRSPDLDDVIEVTNPAKAAAGLLDHYVAKLASTPKGSRNPTLYAAASQVGRWVHAGHLDESIVRQALAGAGRVSGLNEDEITKTLTSGLRKAANHPLRVTIRPRDERTVTVLNADDTARSSSDIGLLNNDDPDERDQRIREALPILDWHELWEAEDEEEWILKPLLPARRLVALYSAPKMGKSLLMLEIAAGLAAGRPVLGAQPEGEPKRVLYVDFENDPRGDIRPRLHAMGYGPDDLTGLCYMSFPSLAALDTQQGGAELMLAVETYGCQVVIIDTVSRAIRGEENENDTWLAFYRHTGKQLKAAGVALIRLDHSGKDEAKGQRGGSAKSGDVDAVWRMSALSETMFRLDCEANRMPVTERSVVLHRRPLPNLHHDVDGDPKAAAHNAKVNLLLEQLEDLELPADTGERRAREALKQMEVRVRNDVLRDAIRRRKRAAGVLLDVDEEDHP